MASLLRDVRGGRQAAQHAVLRRLRRSEGAQFAQHLLRLDAHSRVRRFCRPVSDALVAEYASGCGDRLGMVEGAFVSGVLRGVAELRPYNDGTFEAEAAFSVEAPWQRCGLGARLFQRLVLRARNGGVRSLSMACLPENRAMQKLAKRLGGTLVRWPGEVHGRIDDRPPNAFSAVREGVADLTGALESSLDWWGRNNPLERCGGVA
ncbi:GNAT family N-acetyltransferase [Acuticoccus sp.]|uniref:GNAT family N-acetyltransferase n=1 Tax=Acuticoccus sp. TaxID=1904378 RepID=UPI003B525C5A